jgi:serine/threonine-protein kinase
MPPRTDRPPYTAGHLIDGRYEVVRILAEGGFAVVYEAVDETIGRSVAVKVLRPGIARSHGDSAAQLRRESETLARLHEITPHVVRVITGGVDGLGLPYYVMEYLRGTTLRRRIVEQQNRGEPLPLREALDLGCALATTLTHAHGLGLVHGDLKPENVFMAFVHGGDLVPKLLDFGAGAEAFSLAYAAPERVEGHAIGPATDVYALALVLFELLALRLPHDRQQPRLTAAQLALTLHTQPLPDLDVLGPDAPPRLAQLLAWCLGSTPASRPDAMAMARELRDMRLQLDGNHGPLEVPTNVDAVSFDELHARLEVTDHGPPGRMTGDGAASNADGTFDFARSAPVVPRATS